MTDKKEFTQADIEAEAAQIRESLSKFNPASISRAIGQWGAENVQNSDALFLSTLYPIFGNAFGRTSKDGLTSLLSFIRDMKDDKALIVAFANVMTDKLFCLGYLSGRKYPDGSEEAPFFIDADKSDALLGMLIQESKMSEEFGKTLVLAASMFIKMRDDGKELIEALSKDYDDAQSLRDKVKELENKGKS